MIEEEEAMNRPAAPLVVGDDPYRFMYLVGLKVYGVDFRTPRSGIYGSGVLFGSFGHLLFGFLRAPGSPGDGFATVKPTYLQVFDTTTMSYEVPSTHQLFDAMSELVAGESAMGLIGTFPNDGHTDFYACGFVFDETLPRHGEAGEFAQVTSDLNELNGFGLFRGSFGTMLLDPRFGLKRIWWSCDHPWNPHLTDFSYGDDDEVSIGAETSSTSGYSSASERQGESSGPGS